MSFDKDYRAFMERHLLERTGERQRRLEQGHASAEHLFLKNVW